MQYEFENFILSIIGCITGCTGLLISFLIFLRTLIREHHNVQIDFQESNCIFFPKLESLSEYDSDFQAILHLQLINKSSSPVTVRWFDTFVEKELIEFRPVAISEIFLPINSGKGFMRIPFPDELKFTLPVRLEPYDVKEFLIFYPWFPEPNSKELSGIVKIGTAKGNYRKKFKIHFYL